MTTLQTLEMALEALILARGSIEDWGGYASEYFQNKHDLKGDIENAEKAITALRQALEQPADDVEQSSTESKETFDQPVAWRFKTGTFWNREVHWRYVLSLEGTEGLKGLEPLYTRLQPAAQWVGLTDEEIADVVEDEDWYNYPEQFAKTIEAKLKEKNT